MNPRLQPRLPLRRVVLLIDLPLPVQRRSPSPERLVTRRWALERLLARTWRNPHLTASCWRPDSWPGTRSGLTAI